MFEEHRDGSKETGARVGVTAPNLWTYSNLRNPPGGL